MKRISKILLALSFLAPSLALAQTTQTIPGITPAASVLQTGAPQLRTDNTVGVQMAAREGNTKAVLGHAEYTESTRRGKVFSTVNAAYTIVAANATKSAIGTYIPIVGFINPQGSGVNAVILNHRAWHTSGTTGGPLVFNFYCGLNWVPAVATGAAGWTLYNNLLANNTGTTMPGSAMIVQSSLVPTASPSNTSNMLPFIPVGGPDSTALSSGGEAGHSEDDKGQIVVPPGCLFGIASTATGTSDVVTASLTWEEVAQ